MGFYQGQHLFGKRYTIFRELGKGGIGITYLAKNQKGELRVIKTLQEDLLNSPAWRGHQDKLKQDFRNEALSQSICRHPHIVQVENLFDEGNFPCMAMEYIEGEDLGKRVFDKGALSEAEALLYIKQIGDALTLVHEKGLLHRDLKPSNIMIRRDKKEAVLIDFGIARQFISGAVQQHTQHFTPEYAPPEQYLPDTERGEYTDVYALAATLYNLLTGEPPIPAPARRQNFNLKHPQNYNPSISDRVNAAIMKGMELNYKRRPQSVPEWLGLLGNNISVVSSNIPNVASSKPTFKISTPLPPTVITLPRNWKCLYTIDNDSFRNCAISPDGQVLVSGSADKTIKLWDVRTGKELRTLTGHSDGVNSVAFSPDGEVLVSGSWDKTIKLWDVSTGKELRTLMGHSDGVYSVAFSPDRQVLASGSWDKTIKLWDVSTGKELRTLAGHPRRVNSVTFSPDGQVLASGSWDKTIKLWDVRTGKELCTLTGHSDDVNSVAFSPDGGVLASGSGDKTIKLWDVRTGKELRTLTGHSSDVNFVAFSPDGQMLASSSRPSWIIARTAEIKVWRRV